MNAAAPDRPSAGEAAQPAPPRSTLLRVGLGLRGLVGAALVVASVAVVASTGDTVAHQHPALAALLAVSLLAGVLTLVRVVVLARRAARPTGRRVLRTVGAVAGYGALAVLAGVAWWLRPFPATDVALAALVPDAAVDVQETAGWYAFVPQGTEPTTGLVYSPGARVDVRATAAVLRPLAEAGYLVVALKEPLGIALTSPDQSAQAMAAFDGVDRWAVGGHSLGGVAAAQFAAGHDDEVDGLLLHASYPIGGMSGADLLVTSVWAGEDGLTTAADIEASRANLPATTRFVEVPGAVHAFFADYGPQPGDGTPLVPREQAQAEILTADLALLASVAG